MALHLKQFMAVKGVLPKQADLANWNEDHFLQFFSIVNFFTEQIGNTQVVKSTPEKIKQIEKDTFEGEYKGFKAEILYRIDQFTEDPLSTSRKFYHKLSAMMRVVGKYVKENPSTVTDKIFALIKDNDRMNWCLRNFEMASTNLGVDVLVPDTKDTTNYVTKKVTSSDPQQKLMDAMLHLSDVFYQLSKSINKKDIRNMEAKDRIAAIAKIGPILAQQSKVKVNIGVFNSISSQKSNKEDIEDALLNFNRK